MNDKDGVFIDDYTIAVLTLKSEVNFLCNIYKFGCFLYFFE